MKEIILVLIFIFVTIMPNISYTKEPYYGFYSSEKGVNYKLFRHNIFNFEVNMPKNWTFGVAGESPSQVIMMYPEGVNTGKFVPAYEIISIGIIPIPNVSLVKAYEYTLLGMKQSHKELKIIQKNTNVEINTNKAINFIYTWPSKTGNIIKENVFLVEHEQRIYSITTRTIDPILEKQKKTHEGIVNTFKLIKPVQF